MTCSPPTSRTGKRCASATANLRRSSISTGRPATARRPGSCRFSTARLRSCWSPACCGRRVARPAQVQGARSAIEGPRALGIPLEPDRGLGHPRRAASAGSSALRACSAISATGRASSRSCISLELLSLVVFVGGFAVMLWYAYTVWRSEVALDRARCGASLLVIAARDDPLRGPGLQAHRPDDELLMGARGLAVPRSRRTGSRRPSESRDTCSRPRTSSLSSFRTASSRTRRGGRRLLSRRRFRAHRRRARSASRRDRGWRRPRAAPAADAARRGAQRGRLRDVGPRGEAQGTDAVCGSPGIGQPQGR